jgi:hypothetical protein
MAKFLHVSFNFEGRDPPTDAITKVFNKATDWVTYAPNCWIIYSTKPDASTWYQRIRAVLDEDDSVFVVEINLENRQGWLPTYVWDWIQKDRQKKS